MSSQTKPCSENKRFSIKSWVSVGLWEWDVVVDTCAICQSHIMDMCNLCEYEEQGDVIKDCPIAWGECNVSYQFSLICSMLIIITA